MFPYNPVVVVSTVVCFIVLMLLALFTLAFLVLVIGEATDRYQDINDEEEGAHTSERNNKPAR
jgi:uncharacterized membrane protein